MADLEGRWWGTAPFSKMHPDDKRDVEEIANRESYMRRRAAEACALRELADMRCPEDLRDWGRRHGIPTFAEMTWQAGFAAGYAAGLAHLQNRQQIEQQEGGVDA